MTVWTVATGTDTGRVREMNQDAVEVRDDLVVVADGMGGHAAGEVASALAVATLREKLAPSASSDDVRNSLAQANAAILHDAQENPERLGMGTTAVVLSIARHDAGRGLLISNIGDSRAYQVRHGAIRQLTHDHSVAEEWVRQGRMTAAEAAIHPRRHQLTRVLGSEEKVEVDQFWVEGRKGDYVILCSDGLTNEVSDAEIARIVSAAPTLDAAVAQLIHRACEEGGRDNISVALVRLDDLSEMSVPAPPPATEIPEVLGLARSARRPSLRDRLTWQLGVVLAALLVVLGGSFVIIRWYATSAFYLASDAKGMIGVYQGQPGGVLWFHPTEVISTTYSATDLRPQDVTALQHDIVEPSLAAAVHYAFYINQEWKLSQSLTPSTTPMG